MEMKSSLPGHEATIKVSIADVPAFRVLATAIHEISRLEGDDCYLAPEIAVRAARDAIAIVQERNA